MPLLLREADIQTEYPVDVDDENVTDTGFLPTLPGESTRISSALAFFELSRILTKVLEDLYSSRAEYDVSISKMRMAAVQLDEWLHNLPPHLRLVFSQDKPSTNVTSSRSPLLVSLITPSLCLIQKLTHFKSLVYYFIRSLIHRPAVCFADEHLRSSAVLALADSSKHIVQILQLLDERRLCLSVSINRKELAFFSGLGILWQSMGLKRDSKLAKESQKLLGTLFQQLELESTAATAEFVMLAKALVFPNIPGQESTPIDNQSQDMGAPSQKPKRSPMKQFQALKSRLTPSSKSGSPSRRNTISGLPHSQPSQPLRSPSWSSLPPSQHDHLPTQFAAERGHPLDYGSDPRLLSSSVGYDYPRALSTSNPSDAPGSAITMADWEYVLSDMDRGYSNIFTGIYGGKECGEDPGPFASITAEYSRKPNETLTMPPSHDMHELSPEAWSASSGDLPSNPERTSQSALSYSGESMGSAEESFPPLADASVQPEEMGFVDPFHAITLPQGEEIDEFTLVGGWDRRLAV